MKIHYEITSVADAKRAQVMLAAYIKSVNEPAAAMAVRERLAGPQIHPLKHSGNGKRPGWTPERRAKFKAAIAKRKRKAKVRA